MSTVEPVDRDELSRVGFGCYRAHSELHGEALAQALSAGCNLIDTASNYEDGRSESLVGAVLENTGARAFVVTKVGYISPAGVASLKGAGLRTERLPQLQDGTPFSLEPAVLRVLLELSRSRLGRPTLDAVLLHNPERLIDTGASAAELHTAFERAFEFLDQEVHAGRLRFYGVSSNSLPTACEGTPLDLESIVPLARSGDRDPALSFMEFPLNLLERDAAGIGSRASLFARMPHGVRTIANRPLNAFFDGGLTRLALTGPRASDDGAWQRCVSLVSSRLQELDRPEPWTSFRPMQFLRDSRKEIPDLDLLDTIWERQIVPFIEAVFDGGSLGDARDAFEDLHLDARASTLLALELRTRAGVAHLLREGLLEQDSDEPLAMAACRYCLDAGADHVVVGMRRAEYVTQLAPLFAHPIGQASSNMEVSLS